MMTKNHHQQQQQGGDEEVVRNNDEDDENEEEEVNDEDQDIATMTGGDAAWNREGDVRRMLPQERPSIGHGSTASTPTTDPTREVVRPPLMPNVFVLNDDDVVLKELPPRGSYNYIGRSCTNHYYHRWSCFHHPLRNVPPELFSLSPYILFSPSFEEENQCHHQEGSDNDHHDHRGGGTDVTTTTRRTTTKRSAATTTPGRSSEDNHDDDIQSNKEDDDTHDDKVQEENATRSHSHHVLRIIEAALRIHCSDEDHHDAEAENGDETVQQDDDHDHQHDDLAQNNPKNP